MGIVINPALQAFLDEVQPARELAQVLVQREGGSFTLRHAADRQAPAGTLRAVGVDDLRRLAQFNAAGDYRPLRGAPDLVTGWTCTVPDAPALELALQHLYPGGLTDWFAARQAPVPATSFREFTGRQSGMYRITALLSDAQAGAVIRACCDAPLCLKRRLWTVPGLDPDVAGAKSDLPCLEPCPVMLELARRGMRLEQADKVSLGLAPDDWQVIAAALRQGATGGAGPGRVADVSSPTNLRRLRLVLEKLAPVLAADAPASPSHG